VTRENVEVVRSSIDAYNRRDIETFAGLVTPDFELFTAIIGPVEGGESYRGPDGLARYFDAVSEAWAEIRIVAEEFFDLTDTVLVLGRLEGRGRGGGVPVDSPVGAVCDLRGGKIWRLRPYLDHAEAMRAAGLSD
jgi:ketosteroid isomerase-like protein